MSPLAKNSIYIETILILGFIAAVVFRARWGVYVSLGLLAAIYFLVAINLRKTTEGSFVFGVLRISGVSNAIAICGILFRLVEWPGAESLLFIGFATLIISVFLAVAAILRKSENATFLRFAIIRAMLFVVVISILLLFPQISALPSTVS